MSDSQRATAQELAKVAIFPQLFRPVDTADGNFQTAEGGGVVQLETLDVSRPHTGFSFLRHERLTGLCCCGET